MGAYLHRTIQPQLWRMHAVRGASALAFGILTALLLPDPPVLWLVALFATFGLLSGGSVIFAALDSRRHDAEWGILLLQGAASVSTGAVAVFLHYPTVPLLALLVAANALVCGAIDVALALRLHGAPWHPAPPHQVGMLLPRILLAPNQWPLALSGMVSIGFGVLVFMLTGAGTFEIALMISGYTATTGGLSLLLAARLRGPTLDARDQKRTRALFSH